MLKAHTVIAMIATVMLLWGLSVVVRGLGARLPQLRRRPQRQPHPARRRVSLPVTVFGALVAAGSAPVLWSSLQVNRWQRSFDPTIEPFTPWTGVALGLVAFGGGLVAWGLRGDRPRGRRRCPRCWYDMFGAPGLVCPECGREAAGADELLLARRNRRMIVAGLVIALLAIVPYYTPRVQRGGWVAVVPTTALILGLPWWPDEAIVGGAPGKDDWSLLGRVEEEALFPWQERLLRRRARSLAEASDPARARRLAQLALQTEDMGVLDALAPRLLVHGLDSTADDAVRFDLLGLAVQALGGLERSAAAAIVNPHVLAIAHLVQDDYFGYSAAQLLYYASDATAVSDDVATAFRQPVDWDLPSTGGTRAVVQSPRFAAAVALVMAAESSSNARDTILDALEGRLSPVHRMAALLALRYRERSFPGLAEALPPLMADPAIAQYVARTLYSRRDLAPAAVAQLASAIEAAAEPDDRLIEAAGYLARWRIDPEGVLERLLAHPLRRVRLEVAVALADDVRAEAQVDLDRLLAVLRDLQATAPPDESPGTADRIQTAIGQVEDAIRRRSPRPLD